MIYELYTLQVDKYTENLSTVIENCIANKGIAETYRNIKTRRLEKCGLAPNLLNRLFDIQTRELYEISRMSNKELELSDEPLAQIYNSALQTIKSVLRFSKDFDVVESLSEDSFYHITRLLFQVKSNKVGIEKDNEVKEMFSNLLWRLREPELDKKKEHFLRQIYFSILTYTVCKGEDWFIKMLRKLFSEWLFSTNDRPRMLSVYLMTNWFLDYIASVAPVPKNVKEMVGGFIIEELGSNYFSNEELGWRSIFQKHVVGSYGKSRDILVGDMLSINSSKHIHWLSPIEGVISYDSSQEASSGSVLNWLFSILFETLYLQFAWNDEYQGESELPSYPYPENSVLSIFNDCSEMERRNIARLLNDRWLNEERNGIDVSNVLPTLLKNDGRDIAHLNQYKSTQVLLRWVSEVLGEEVQETTEAIVNDSTEHDKIRVKMLSTIKQEIESLYGFSATTDVPVSKARAMTLLAEWDTPQPNTVHMQKHQDVIIDSMHRTIVYEIAEETKKQFSKTVIKNKADADAFIKVAKKAKVTHSAVPDWEVYQLMNLIGDIESNSNVGWFQGLQRAENVYLSLHRNTVWREGAFSFGFSVDEEKSIVRPLTTDEINRMIDERYRRPDGRYFYTDNRYNIFTQREKLYKILESKYFVMQLVFRYESKVDKKGMLCFVMEANV